MEANKAVDSDSEGKNAETVAFVFKRLKEANKIIEEQKNQIETLQRELDKTQCVLESINNWKEVITHAESIDLGIRSKKQAISAEILEDIEINPLNIITDEKDIKFICDAFDKNDFFKHLDKHIIKKLIQFMYEFKCENGFTMMKEGECGKKLFLLKSGKLGVEKSNIHIGHILPGSVFGELALIYNCPRTATIKASKNSQFFVLDRNVFKNIMMKSEIKQKHDQIEFLKTIPLTSNLSYTKLSLISNCMEKECHCFGDIVVRQGEVGELFFIISEGYVKVVQDNIFKRKLGPGDYFGEQAILTTNERTASVICISEIVECFTIDKKSLNVHLKNFTHISSQKYVDTPGTPKCLSQHIPEELINATVEDLEVISTLGVGGFGRVELVKLKNSDNTYALKCLIKKFVVKTNQQKHVMQEKDILMACSSPFIVKLYKTFKDTRMVYFLMEVALGGEVWTILRNKHRFSSDTARFCIASVILALEYLHSRHIVFRDLKPENMMLNSQGNVLLIDFGFAKYLSKGEKTWTFCGTPEYVAPEIILNKGHDFAVDIWSLGILTFELITGMPPFVGKDPMSIYKQAFRGVAAMDFPRYVNKKILKFIESTCKINPIERLGYGKTTFKDLKSTSWLTNFEWDKLESMNMKTLLPTTVKSATDTRNFDKFPKSSKVADEEFSGWDREF